MAPHSPCVLLTRDDEHDLSRFFGSLPEEFKRYLGAEIMDRRMIARWMRELIGDVRVLR